MRLPVSDSSIIAMASVVQASLAALEIALGDMEQHPQAALKRAVDEAETLSSAAVRLMKLIGDGPRREKVNADAVPRINIDEVTDLLDRLCIAAYLGTCPECGGVKMDHPDDVVED